MTAEAATAERANPRSLPQPLTSICAGLAVIGAAAFVIGLFQDPQKAWLAYQANFVYYAALAQAGVVLACIFTIVGAQWPGPVRRIAEGLGAWVPVSLVLGVLGGFGYEHIFSWHGDAAPAGKEGWLNFWRVYLTDVGILAVLALLSLAFLRASVRPTLHGAAQNTQGFARRMVERWTANWRGEAAEREASEARMRVLAPIICLVYALGFSMFAFDQVMSMEPAWYSNLFGAYVAWGGILSAVAATALAAVLHRGAPGLEGEITRKRMHDLGKMLFAFSIFWMYLFFSQYLVIYYGNIPEETFYLRDRLGSQFLNDKGFTERAWALTWSTWDFTWERFREPYVKVSMAAWACNWIIPFWVLLGQRPKRTPWILGPVAGIMLLGFWLERNVLVWPSVVKADGWAWSAPLPLLIGAGFLGAFVLVFLIYTRVFPSLAIPRHD